MLYHRTDDIALHIVDCAATACFTVGGKIPVSVVAAQGSDDDTRMSTLFRQLIAGQFFIGLIHDATEGVIDIVEGLPTKAVHGKGEVFNICRQFCEIDANDFIISIPSPVRLSPEWTTDPQLDFSLRNQMVSILLPAASRRTQPASRSMESLPPKMLPNNPFFLTGSQPSPN